MTRKSLKSKPRVGLGFVQGHHDLRTRPGLKVCPRKILGVVGLHNVPGLFSSGSQVLDGAI